MLFRSYGITVKKESFDKDFYAVIKRSREVAATMSKGVQFLMKKNKIDVIMGYGILKAGKKVDWREMPAGGIRPHARPGFLQQRPARHQYFPIVGNITGEGEVQWRVGGVNGGFGGRCQWDGRGHRQALLHQS